MPTCSICGAKKRNGYTKFALLWERLYFCGDECRKRWDVFLDEFSSIVGRDIRKNDNYVLGVIMCRRQIQSGLAADVKAALDKAGETNNKLQ